MTRFVPKSWSSAILAEQIDEISVIYALNSPFVIYNLDPTGIFTRLRGTNIGTAHFAGILLVFEVWYHRRTLSVRNTLCRKRLRQSPVNTLPLYSIQAHRSAIRVFLYWWSTDVTSYSTRERGWDEKHRFRGIYRDQGFCKIIIASFLYFNVMIRREICWLFQRWNLRYALDARRIESIYRYQIAVLHSWFLLSSVFVLTPII